MRLPCKPVWFYVCVAWLAAGIPSTVTGQSLDGHWQGQLSCSENVRNQMPAYSIQISIDLLDGLGRGLTSNNQTSETYELGITSGNRVEFQATGRRHSDKDPRWFTRLSGAIDRDQLVLTGQMWAGDGVTVVRAVCTAQLVKSTPDHAVSSLASEHDQMTERLLRELASTAGTANTPSATQAPSSELSKSSHSSFRIREVTPKLKPLTFRETQTGPGGLPRGQGHAIYLPEDWLIGEGQPWHYRSAPGQDALPVPVRQASADESRVMEKARSLMQGIESRVLVLSADGAIIDVISTGGISFQTRLMSASMGKTVAALAAGKAICSGYLSMDQRAEQWIPSLAGTALGAATLRHVLMMASGTTEPSQGDYVGITNEEVRHYLEGPGNLEQLLSSTRQSTAQRGLFGKIKPGQQFSYKSRDPFTVAMMIERSVGMPATLWVENQLLRDFKAEHSVVLGTDRSGYFHGAAGIVRMTLIDWIRFAIYVDKQRQGDSCFAGFIKDMGSTQIRAHGVMNSISGYGYLTWTDNALAPNTFWAAGYGGQRIGWSADPTNRRIFMMFSNSADRNTDQIYPVAKEWLELGRRR